MSKKILVIDDDPVILQGIMLVLRDAGYDVDCSVHGEVAHKKAKEYKPDLILLDVMLSGIDGRTLLQEFKHQKATKDVPIVMISASEDVEKDVYKFGADDFIPKPFNTEQLLDTIEHQIKK
jgi:DNA-binding response OmpR family regulator